MAQTARCESCGDALPKLAVMFLVPVCPSCGSVQVKLGGIYGWSSAYGVSDPAIMKDLVGSALQVLHSFIGKYKGEKRALEGRLSQPAEAYATMPGAPELLEIQRVRNPVEALGDGLLDAYAWPASLVFPNARLKSIAVCFILLVIGVVVYLAMPKGLVTELVFGLFVFIHPIIATLAAIIVLPEILKSIGQGQASPDTVPLMVVMAGGAVWIAVFVVRSFASVAQAVRENGSRPQENERRLAAHRIACERAMRQAEEDKGTADYEIVNRLRELEGLIATLEARIEEIRHEAKSL